MNENEINEKIHVEIMGGCLHKSGFESVGGTPTKKASSFKCRGCDLVTGSDGLMHTNWLFPDYCQNISDAFAAQTKAIERFGDEYTYAVFEILGLSGSNDLQKNYGKLIGADAKTRCAAIVNLLENEK